MRWKLAFILQEKGYVDTSLSGVLLFEEAEQIVQRRFKKQLRQLGYDELRKTLGVIQNRW